MDNFPSFTSSQNFNHGLSIEGQSQDLSIKSSKADFKKSERQGISKDQYDQESEPKTSRKSKKAEQQPIQNYHKHDSFDQINQEDAELGYEVDFIGPNGQKKIKSEATKIVLNNQAMKPIRMEEESERKESKQSQSIAEMFNKMRLSNGEESVFYEYDPNQQEEGRLFADSLRDMFSKKCKIASDSMSEIDGLDRITEKAGDLVSFQFTEPELENYTVVGILGKGLHGLVIKMRSKYSHDAVIKLFEKENEADFLNEIMILQNVKKAQELKILKSCFEEAGIYDSRDDFTYEYFKGSGYFGLFVKEGLGSLFDFKEYLKECKKEDDNFELSAQELLIITWSLLDACYRLHKINHCHRDIKPANIVIAFQTFLPELIDYSLASEISKVKGAVGVGTPGYRREDFKERRDSLEEDLRDRLILNDYFALGKTILELAFPTFNFRNMKDIKDKLKKLEKSKEKKLIARILEICIFGNMQSKEAFLLGSQSESLKGMDPKEKEMYEEMKINSYQFENAQRRCEFFKRHLEKFKAFMMTKWSLSKNNTESEFQKIASKIISIKSQEKEIIKLDNEINLLYNEEREIKESFKKNPQKAKMKCYEVIEKLARKDYPIVNSQIYSTLMSVLYLTDSLENALCFGEDIASLPAVEESWVFKYNLAFLKTKKMELEKGYLSFEGFTKDLKYFLERQEGYFIDDLERILASAARYCYLEKGNFNEMPLEKDILSCNDEEIFLSFFKIQLQHPGSYFFMNYSFILASWLDDEINEEVRESIKQFVYDINHQDRVRVLSLVDLSTKERVLFAVMNFCKIFESIDCTNSEYLQQMKEEANQIIALKEKLQANNEENENSFWDLLMEPDITLTMIGCIIHYNLEYNLITNPTYFTYNNPNSPPAEWRSDPSKVTFINEERRFNPQKYLDSIMSWIIESPEKEDYLITINLMKDTPYEIHCLLFFGKRLKDLILYHRFIGLKGCMLFINPSEDLVSLFALKMNFRLTDHDDMKSIDELFIDSNIKKFANLEALTVGLWGYTDEKISLKMLNKIVEQLSILQLSHLDIRMVKQIIITDEGFVPILNWIWSQAELAHLALQFNLSLITSKSIELLADAIINLQELRKLRISFRNCSKIESTSIEAFILEIQKSPELKNVHLRFIACSEVRNLVKPKNLSYELEIDLAITDGYIPVELDENIDEDDEYCDLL